VNSVSDLESQQVLLKQVLDSFDESLSPRLVEVLRAAVRHLHAFVVETGLTRDEWIAGIQFLTDTGKKCVDSRQEFILLSDTLGVSMLVEIVNQGATDKATDATVLGPFYVADSPSMEMGAFIGGDDDDVTPLMLNGTVRGADGGVLEDAIVEVWQVAPNGLYDVQDVKGVFPNYRATFLTGADGKFSLRTSRPVDYQIPVDGPVGTMLKATGRHSWRAAHTHFRVSRDGYKTVVTHVFDSASLHLTSDAVFGVRESLIVNMSGPTATFDITLDAV
jgi:protocatechuate 3,4-dioxygenase beta subunit